MSTIKFTNEYDWKAIESHLSEAADERFAFAFTKTLSDGPKGPVLEVVGIAVVADDEVERAEHGWSIKDEALDRIHNQALTNKLGIVEFHNHRVGPPGFSQTDEHALEPMVQYTLDLLKVPYAAAVWAQGTLHAEWWRERNGAVERGFVTTVVILGNHFRVLNVRPQRADRFARQLPLIGEAAQAAIDALRLVVVGAGGTGSYVVLQLAYLGFRNIVLLDDDVVEATNLNRLVTADNADVGIPKALVAKRRVRSIDPSCQIAILPALTVFGDHPEFEDADLIIGCVDHDGPRQRLSQIAIETRTPYIDIATGVDQSAIGGRVVLVRPGRPCLMCMGELDSAEVGRWAKSSEQRDLDRQHGYGTAAPNPSVVYLNGLVVSAAIAELAAWLSGARRPAEWLDIDLRGDSKCPGVNVGPLKLDDPEPSCISCSRATYRVAFPQPPTAA